MKTQYQKDKEKWEREAEWLITLSLFISLILVPTLVVLVGRLYG